MTPWTRPALRKLFRIHEHIAREDTEAANRLITRLYQAANHLENFPQLGRPGLAFNLRELVVPATPYILRYRIRGGQARVIDIKHGSQQNY